MTFLGNPSPPYWIWRLPTRFHPQRLLAPFSDRQEPCLRAAPADKLNGQGQAVNELAGRQRHCRQARVAPGRIEGWISRGRRIRRRAGGRRGKQNRPPREQGVRLLR